MKRLLLAFAFPFAAGLALSSAAPTFAAAPAAVAPTAPTTSATPTAVAPTAVAPFTKDLGRGLVYHRVKALPADLPNADAARKRPTVLDVRYVDGGADAATALVAWLKFYASLHTPVFVLANAETDRPIRQALANRGPLGHVLVIGASSRGFTPDIAVPATADVERRAYDALAAGAEPAALITENPDKARNDEASLSRDRASEPGDAAKDHAPPPPLDAALQRAVHLHRALVALKKI